MRLILRQTKWQPRMPLTMAEPWTCHFGGAENLPGKWKSWVASQQIERTIRLLEQG